MCACVWGGCGVCMWVCGVWCVYECVRVWGGCGVCTCVWMCMGVVCMCTCVGGVVCVHVGGCGVCICVLRVGVSGCVGVWCV